MGIFNRLGTVINSYFSDFENETAGRLRSSQRSSGDPDFDAAYEELNDFLNKKNPKSERAESSRQYSWKDDDSEFNGFKSNAKTSSAKNAGYKLPPEELRADFEILNVPFGADDETCKQAYKKLLKIHHPDRHAGHAGNYKKATEKSAKINAAWDRIENWRHKEGGK